MLHIALHILWQEAFWEMLVYSPVFDQLQLWFLDRMAGHVCCQCLVLAKAA